MAEMATAATTVTVTSTATTEGEPRARILPDPAKRPSLISGILQPPQETPITVTALVERCAAQIAEHLRHLADWPGTPWKVGDHNQYQISTALEDGAELVFTLSSEPLEDVHWRVTARAGGAEVAGFDRGRREPLRRFGFSPSGDHTRWERDVRIASSREAAVTAYDIIALLVEVFGYNGQSPLSFALSQGQRGETGVLYRTIAPEDLRKLLHGWGYRAELGTTASGNPVIRSGAGGYKFHILFAWPAKDSRLFGCVNFVTVFTSRPGLTHVMVNEISRTSRFCRLYLDEENDLILERDVNLTGGVAADYLHECLLDWACMMESVYKKVDKLVVPPVVVH